LVACALAGALTLAIQAASPKDTAIVSALELNSGSQSLEAKITMAEKSRYTYFELDSPRRLVVDFHGLKNGLNFTRKKVGAAGVEQIRTSFFDSKGRKATRVVFDLDPGVNYLVASDGDGVVRVVFGELSAPIPAAPTTPGVAIAANSPSSGTSATNSSSNSATVVKEVPAADAVPLNLIAGPPVLLPAPQSGTSRVNLASLLAAVEPIAQQPAAAVQVSVGTAAPPAAQASQTPAPAPAPALPPISGGVQIISAAQAGAPVLTAPAQPQTFNGEMITLDLKDADFKDFFRLIGDISGLNVVLDTNVGGTFTLRLTDVPWDQALDIVLRNYNFGGVLQGNVLRIATAATLRNEETARRLEREAVANATPTIARTFVLNYTRAGDVATTLSASGVLSARGRVATEARRNAIIVTDVPVQFENIEKMVAFIDVAAQQVEIEARLLAANKSFSRELGSQLGLLVGANSGNVLTGAAGGSPFSRTPTPRATIDGNGLPLLSDLPAAATSGIAFLLQPGGDILLDAIITAAEAKGTAKLMSRPKVTTQNNVPATISQGTQIPVQANVNNTISVQFLTFALKLDVTPQITEAGTILLTVQIENSQPDFARSVNGVPSVSTQQARTTMLVPDGNTMTIGGIYVDTDTLNIRQVPGLGSIPIIGNLFKNTQTIKSQAELLFFITPRIRPADPIVTPAAN
jgi:type IV pilus assembly protein PilQ